MHAGRVNPAVVKVEQAADRDGVIDSFIRPAGALHLVNIFLANLIRCAIDLIDEGEQGFLFVRQTRDAIIIEDLLDEFRVFQKRRSTCGVRADSERAIITARREGGDQFAHAGRERRRPAHHALREIR